MIGDPIGMFIEQPHGLLDKYVEIHCVEHGRIAIMLKESNSLIKLEKHFHVIEEHNSLSKIKYKHER